MSQTVKASVWFVICGILKDVIDVLMTPVFTRILTAEQYGVYNVYNSWFQIVKIVFTLYLFSDVFNVGLLKFEKDRDRFISSTLGFISSSILIYFAFYLIFRKRVEQFTEMPSFLNILLFLHVFIYVPYYCWIRRERFDYQYRKVVIISSLYIILQPLLGIVAIKIIPTALNPGYTRILAAVFVQFVIGIILYTTMMLRGKSYFNWGYWKYSLKTGIVLVPYNLSKIVLNQSDRLMINHFSGSAYTAIYSVAHSAAFVLQVVTESLNGAFIPWLYRKLKAGEKNGISKAVSSLILLAAVGVAAIDMVAPEIIQILGSEEYHQGLYCIPPLVNSVFLIFIYTMFTNMELFFEKNHYVAFSSFAGMIVNISLNAVFIPRYGFVAAGYTTLVSYALICIFHLSFLRKCLRENGIRISELIDLKTIGMVSCLILILTLSCNILYKWTVVRWGLVIMMGVLMIALREKWLPLLKRLKEKA